jgi:hypothetical protein
MPARERADWKRWTVVGVRPVQLMGARSLADRLPAADHQGGSGRHGAGPGECRHSWQVPLIGPVNVCSTP